MIKISYFVEWSNEIVIYCLFCPERKKITYDRDNVLNEKNWKPHTTKENKVSLVSVEGM